ncbi:aaa family atpase [Diplodia corticola]|uniref:Aaa family atpase n=1 Tax=Diplodia corticola TaxID=236234 RepID=A0A1J9QTN1_9PEZI|nr:aaa family atpase [Diplodia corticola]OJD31753.1 aaa family atpase [Diplodia corticola]
MESEIEHAPVADDPPSTGARDDNFHSQLEAKENADIAEKVGQGKTRPDGEVDDSGDDGAESDDLFQGAIERDHRSESIANRRKKRDIRRRQHSRYMLLLDDRLEFLEEEVRKLKKEGIKEDETIEPKPAIPDLHPMSWTDYLIDKGDEIPPVHHVIDLLMDEPVIFQRSSLWVTEGKAKKGGVGGAGFDKLHSGTIGPQLTTLPERIRINCQQLSEVLATSITDDVLSHTANKPMVLRRPFKVLTYHEKTIQMFMARKEEALSKAEKNHGDGKMAVAEGSSDGKGPDVAVDGDAVSEKVQPDDQPEAESPEKRLVKHLHLLLRFVADYIKPARERVATQQRIAFQDVYLLFEPGQLVYVRHPEHPQSVWRLLQVTGGNRFLRPYDTYLENEDTDFKKMKRDAFSQLTLDCYFLVFDGSKFQRVYNRFSIRYFSDDQQMKNLWILPYDTAKHLGLVDEPTLLSNGKQYKDCTDRAKVCHRYYRGKTVDRDPQGRRLKISTDSEMERMIFTETIEGTVIVDFEKVYRYNPAWMPRFNEIEEHKHHAREFEMADDPNYENVQDDFIWDQRRREEYLEEEETGLKARMWERGEVQDEDILLLPDRVPAFVLRSRKWVYLQLGYEVKEEDRKPRLTEVLPNDEAWNELQLPGGDAEQGHKGIIQSLVGKHLTRGLEFDLVRDKGRGLIVLLHGAPDVGKTSTAECVSGARGQPLLPITCGDLGLQPELVETNLSRHFELAQSWDCILLLDEADVFLAERSLKDLQRNALVSVFLRILEYYEGILFLTTNKVGLIDEAFKSRIHMSLHYPWLTEDQTQQIWRNLIRKAKTTQKNLEVNEADILLFAMKHMRDQKDSPYGKGPDGDAPGWNGRQIRNAFMSAIALADYEARKASKDQVVLTKEHFKIVAKASNDFDNYLWRVHAFQSDSKRAEKNLQRYDSYQQSPSTLDGRTAVQRPSFYDQAARPVTPGRQLNLPSARYPYQAPSQPIHYGQSGLHAPPPPQAYNVPQGQQPYYPPAPQPPQQHHQTAFPNPAPQYNPGMPPPQDSPHHFPSQYQAHEAGSGQAPPVQPVQPVQSVHQGQVMPPQAPSSELGQQWTGYHSQA